MSTENRIKELAAKIEQANREYFNEDNPSLTDAEYDLLRIELRKLAPDHPVLSDIGAPTKGKQRKHEEAMTSLNKAHSKDDLQKWFSRNAIQSTVELIMMPKIDGIALSVNYDCDGILESIVTRGNGVIGEDVTETARCIDSIPKKVTPGIREIRGEATIFDEDFYGIQDVGDDAKKNPRNTAAGAIRNSDSSEVVKRKVNFVAYQLQRSIAEYYMHSSKLVRLYPLCKYVVPYRLINTAQALLELDLVQAYESIRKELACKCGSTVMTDGLVVRINGTYSYKVCGDEGKNPAGAIAFKFPPEIAVTTLTGIAFEMSRLGNAVPVFVFQPVQLAGTTVTRATGNNMQWVIESGFAVGDKIKVQKAGEIIPEVVGIAEKRATEKYTPPDKCPRCDTQLVQTGAHLVCTNLDCPAKEVGRWLNALDKLDIKNVGEATVETLLGHHNGANLFSLSRPDIVSAGFGAQEAGNIYTALHSTKTAPLSSVLAALGAPGWGRSLFQSLPLVLQRDVLNGNARIEDLMKVEGVGVKRAETLCYYLKRSRIQLFLQWLMATVTPEMPKEGKLSGKVFCVTGTLTVPRKEIWEAILSNGGSVKGSVTKAVTYLVVGEGDDSRPSEKIKAALAYNIPVLTETQFKELLK